MWTTKYVEQKSFNGILLVLCISSDKALCMVYILLSHESDCMIMQVDGGFQFPVLYIHLAYSSVSQTFYPGDNPV